MDDSQKPVREIGDSDGVVDAGTALTNGLNDGMPSVRRSGSRRLRVWALAIGVGVLFVLVVLRGLPVALAGTWPDLALLIDPQQPRALLAKSKRLRNEYFDVLRKAMETNAAEGGKKPEQAAGDGAPQADAPALSPQAVQGELQRLRQAMQPLLRRVIVQEPLNATAFRILGEIETDLERTRRFMTAAYARSRRDDVAVFWLMNDANARQLWPKVMTYADIIMRTSPELVRYVMPYLVQLGTTPAGTQVLSDALAANPPWRQRFFVLLYKNAGNPQAIMSVLLALKKRGNTPTDAELSPFLRGLLRDRNYGLAYYTWVNLLPEEKLSTLGHLNDGSFENGFLNVPFGWFIGRHQNATVAVERIPDAKDGARALHFTMGPGRVKFPRVAQYLKVPDGAYVLRGYYRGTLRGRRGLTWRAYCVQSDGRHEPIASSDQILGVAHTWHAFSLEFDTARTGGCQLLFLRAGLLPRSESERLISGDVWFDAISLAPAQNP